MEALSTGATSKGGTAAPTGYTWSELQNNTGNTTESNTSLGLGGTFSSSTASFFLADDFTVPAGSSWQMTTIDFFCLSDQLRGDYFTF
ncbi:hypothetical protein [Chryseobacterium carnipullorum]|uniref:Uncharacterized protein n=1 Tax=Chryseobacterium carnipullorum TaxID=1124835 RepID=A0A376DW03_CHRCU|nr:hypothetical protein [Chryseobacterium carnipullorum]STC96737.1 Uncharacterised protein [Chryseobacterium carnipullorum]